MLLNLARKENDIDIYKIIVGVRFDDERKRTHTRKI